MAKVEKKPTTKNEAKTPKTQKKVSKKETPQTVIVLRALDNDYPAWSNGLVLEASLLEQIHPVHTRDVLDKLIAEKMVRFDMGAFSYQITEYGKFYLDSVII